MKRNIVTTLCLLFTLLMLTAVPVLAQASPDDADDNSDIERILSDPDETDEADTAPGEENDTPITAVPDDAAPASSATATTTDDIPDGTASTTDTSSEEKQFVAFETKSGKVFYLIIDNEKVNDNVYLLTEVSESDLLNFVETESDNSGTAIGDTITDTGGSNFATPEESADASDQTDAASLDELVQAESEAVAANLTTILMVLLIGAAAIAGYYFKIYKPKKQPEMELWEDDEDDEPEEVSAEEEAFENEDTDEEDAIEIAKRSEAGSIDDQIDDQLETEEEEL